MTILSADVYFFAFKGFFAPLSVEGASFPLQDAALALMRSRIETSQHFA
jgi:lipid-binding SYLF domain-containing protein